MEENRCDICDRTFSSQEGLEAHNKAKHPEKIPKEKKPLLTKKTKNRGLFIVILGLIIWGLISLTQGSSPQGEDFSIPIPILPNRDHVSSTESFEYNSNPPTSGPHYSTPARPGFRENIIDDGNLIHSMEHGLIWISYNPDIGTESEKLKEVENLFTVITQREKNDEDIALAAWGRLDTFNLEDGTIDADDLKRIDDFVKRYANKGPERISPENHGGI